MAIDIGDADFARWLTLQGSETRWDLEQFWRREVLRHPYIRAYPKNAGLLRKTMLLAYAQDQHDYDPAQIPELVESEASPASTDWRSRWPKQQGA